MSSRKGMARRMVLRRPEGQELPEEPQTTDREENPIPTNEARAKPIGPTGLARTDSANGGLSWANLEMGSASPPDSINTSDRGEMRLQNWDCTPTITIPNQFIQPGWVRQPLNTAHGSSITTFHLNVNRVAAVYSFDRRTYSFLVSFSVDGSRYESRVSVPAEDLQRSVVSMQHELQRVTDDTISNMFSSFRESIGEEMRRYIERAAVEANLL